MFQNSHVEVLILIKSECDIADRISSDEVKFESGGPLIKYNWYPYQL